MSDISVKPFVFVKATNNPNRSVGDEIKMKDFTSRVNPKLRTAIYRCFNRNNDIGLQRKSLQEYSVSSKSPKSLMK